MQTNVSSKSNVIGDRSTPVSPLPRSLRRPHGVNASLWQRVRCAPTPPRRRWLGRVWNRMQAPRVLIAPWLMQAWGRVRRALQPG